MNQQTIPDFETAYLCTMPDGSKEFDHDTNKEFYIGRHYAELINSGRRTIDDLFENEWTFELKENTWGVNGRLVDGKFYAALMNMAGLIEEKSRLRLSYLLTDEFIRSQKMLKRFDVNPLIHNINLYSALGGSLDLNNDELNRSVIQSLCDSVEYNDKCVESLQTFRTRCQIPDQLTLLQACTLLRENSLSYVNPFSSDDICFRIYYSLHNKFRQTYSNYGGLRIEKVTGLPKIAARKFFNFYCGLVSPDEILDFKGFHEQIMSEKKFEGSKSQKYIKEFHIVMKMTNLFLYSLGIQPRHYREEFIKALQQYPDVAQIYELFISYKSNCLFRTNQSDAQFGIDVEHLYKNDRLRVMEMIAYWKSSDVLPECRSKVLSSADDINKIPDIWLLKYIGTDADYIPIKNILLKNSKTFCHKNKEDIKRWTLVRVCQDALYKISSRINEEV